MLFAAPRVHKFSEASSPSPGLPSRTQAGSRPPPPTDSRSATGSGSASQTQPPCSGIGGGLIATTRCPASAKGSAGPSQSWSQSAPRSMSKSWAAAASVSGSATDNPYALPVSASQMVSPSLPPSLPQASPSPSPRPSPFPSQVPPSSPSISLSPSLSYVVSLSPSPSLPLSASPSPLLAPTPSPSLPDVEAPPRTDTPAEECVGRVCVEAVAPVLDVGGCENATWVPLAPQTALPNGCSCGAVVYDRDGILALLAHTGLSFVGDSTMRRAAWQLLSAVQGLPFHEGGHVHAILTVNGTAVAELNSHWYPRISELLAYEDTFVSKVAVDGGASHDRLFLTDPASGLTLRRHVYVLGYSTHDLAPNWFSLAGLHAAAQGLFLREWVTNVTTAVTTFQKLVEPGSIVLFRLPIHQCCDARYFGVATNLCDNRTLADPVNAQVRQVTRMLRESLGTEAPDVPLLPMEWTGSPNGYDRHACAPCDKKGTHFGTDLARMAFVQQVLNAVRVLTPAG